jgi:3-oxoadipate enol-lactonase
MTHQFMRVGDLDMHYELADYTEPWRSEEPETFLLHSGYCRNMEFWRSWVPLLGLDYRVLRLDPRGWGETSKPPPGSPITLDMMVKDAIGLMDALGIGKVHWVGDSTGGVVGLKAAHDFPDRLASATVFNSAAKMGNETRATYALDQADQAAAILKYGVEEWCLRTIRWRVDLEHAPEGIGKWIAREMGKTPAHVAAAGFREFSTADLTPLLPEIRTPTLLILGSKCTPRRHQHMAEMQKAMPNAKLLVVDGWEQGLHFLKPETVVGEIRTFIREMVR